MSFLNIEICSEPIRGFGKYYLVWSYIGKFLSFFPVIYVSLKEAGLPLGFHMDFVYGFSARKNFCVVVKCWHLQNMGIMC
jgi:hypothetical protein